MNLISIREEKSDGVISQKEMKIEEYFEAMKSLRIKHECLENQTSDMKIVMVSTT